MGRARKTAIPDPEVATVYSADENGELRSTDVETPGFRAGEMHITPNPDSDGRMWLLVEIARRGRDGEPYVRRFNLSPGEATALIPMLTQAVQILRDAT